MDRKSSTDNIAEASMRDTSDLLRQVYSESRGSTHVFSFCSFHIPLLTDPGVAAFGVPADFERARGYRTLIWIA
jgi:hypothetical protein